MNEDAGPIFRQVAAEIENAIVEGSLAEESQAPSSNELAAFQRIHPATAAKGLNLAVFMSWLGAWREVGDWFADQSTATLTIGLPLALAVLAATASFPGIRRVVP